MRTAYETLAPPPFVEVVGVTSAQEMFEAVESRYEEMDSKSVMDSDGFYTDYTWYKDMLENRHVFVFGDRDLYRPEDGNFDYECESDEETEEYEDKPKSSLF